MAFDSGDNRIARPDMSALPGFVGETGFQGIYVPGELASHRAAAPGIVETLDLGG